MTKTCQTCGFENLDDATFCESCGAKVTAFVPAAAPKSVQPQQPTVPPMSATTPPTAGAGATQQSSTPSTKVKCPLCGTDNDPGTEFCDNCGSKMSGAPVAPAIKPIAKLVLPQGDEIQISSLPHAYGRGDFARVDKSEYISRRHFEISSENGKFYVVDAGSTNGTSVNQVKISSKTEIKDGDTIELAGVISLTFKAS